MKGFAGGEKQGRGRALRLESHRFRLLSIVVGCFVFSIVFLLSSRPDAIAFDTGQSIRSVTRFASCSDEILKLCCVCVFPVSPKASLQDARRPAAAVKTLRPSAGFGTCVVGLLRCDACFR
jgi:hypothetical protein